MARKTNTRTKNEPTPTIIGAGITEQWYFTHLRELYDYRIKVKPRFFGKENAYAMEKRIEKVLSDDGLAVCVFDADVSTWNDDERKKLDDLKEKYANEWRVLLCDSMPSVEYWFLLHFEETNRHFGSSKATVQSLKKHVPDYDKSERFLKSPKWVKEMSSDGKQEDACSRAKRFCDDDNSHSWSRIYKVFEIIKRQ